jgi:SAM-dependent methyltransferase
MIDSLRPFSATPAPCKICGGVAAPYGVVDFHKSCAEANGVRLPLSGVPIYYRRCIACDFLFTDAFDDWSHDQFKAHIYNDDYQTVDPDYLSKRPSENAGLVAQLWDAHKAATRVLDYGGGNDVFCAALRARGFQAAVTYDPMTPEHARRPDGKFELVTCFETLEHLPDPAAGIAAILEYAADTGLIFFSTYAQPADFNNYGLHWWYVGPRNGHVSIFSRQSLKRAFGAHGYKYVACSDNLHLAFRKLPQFLAHLDTSRLDQPDPAHA